MRYSEMIASARAKGIASEAVMYAGIEAVDELLETLKEHHPDKYWAFIRKTHESLYGPHYDEEFANHDICKMHSKDATGAHWTQEEVIAATMSMSFDTGVSASDKWVAANAMWHDLHSVYSDDEILRIAYLFFFNDEDWNSEGKIWDYMNCNR